MHDPQFFFFFVLAYTFLGVLVDDPTCFSCFNSFGQNLLFELPAEFFWLSPYSLSGLSDCRPEATPE